MKIAIIDTGFDESISLKVIKGEYVCEKNAGVIAKKAKDINGHGTAIVNIIYKINPAAELYIYKLPEDKENVGVDALIAILEFIRDYNRVDIINISAGVTYISDYYGLKNVCDKLFKGGTLIVAAYDNEGAISYPAAYASVIGVEVNNDVCIKSIEVNSNSNDLCVPFRYYRTLWLNEIKTLMTGTSFACADITGKLSQYLSNEEFANEHYYFKELLSGLHAEESRKANIFAPQFKINKAIVVFYNKESDVLIRNRKDLVFELIGIYDVSIKGHVGKTINNMQIQSIEKINWEDDFDTLVLSHSKDLSLMTGKPILSSIIEKAGIFKKNIYAFEEITDIEYEKLFYPQIKNYPIYTSRLKKISVPCVEIVGTSSRQGKFTLQLEIIRSLKKLGYNVGAIMTEPSGYLFGADFVFPMGYNSTIHLNMYEYIYCLNEQLFNIEIQNRDIVICSCQSGTIHYDVSNLNQYAICQYGFLLGTNPDNYILCVNIFDEKDYIERTINFLNSLYEGRVMGIALLPVNREYTQNGILKKTYKMNTIQLESAKNDLELSFNLPVYIIGTNDIWNLTQNIIKNFEEE